MAYLDPREIRQTVQLENPTTALEQGPGNQFSRAGDQYKKQFAKRTANGIHSRIAAKISETVNLRFANGKFAFLAMSAFCEIAVY